uniref:Hydrogenase maturation protease n=1 Tax=Ignisphaera aggregans TaxID=334771 RepID=A0A7J2U2S1_9CREN
MIKLSVTEACKYIKKLLSINYALVCVGTYLRNDDAACLELCDKLQYANTFSNIIKCEFGLENCINEISQREIEGILICDAVISNSLKPGSIVKFDLRDIDENIGIISTHSIPLTYVIAILNEMNRIKNIEMLGIVAHDLSVGMQLSKPVKNSVDQLYKCLRD